MITEGLDYDKHYATFDATEIGKLASKQRAILSQIHEMKRSCKHPENHLQWLSQGDVNLFYCGSCGVSFTLDARNSMDDFIATVRKRMKKELSSS
jgi:two-component SAPR family response regulator